MNNRFLFLLALFTSVGFAHGFNESVKVMESFEEGIPETLRVVGGELSLDSLRYKHGCYSLKWDWVGNDRLIFDTPIGYHRQRNLAEVESKGRDQYLKDGHSSYDDKVVLEPSRGFFMWIYNEHATSQRLRFQFGRGERVDCEFDYELNFSGWRTVWIIYDRGDMRGNPRPDMDRMTILAPNVGRGSFYIDALGLSLPLNARNNAPNMQLPNIDPHPRLVTQYAQRLLQHHSYQPSFPQEKMTTSDVDALRALDSKAEAFILPNYLKESLSDKTDIADLREDFSRFNIRREG